MPRPLANLLVFGVTAAGAAIAARQRRRRAARFLGNNPGNQG